MNHYHILNGDALKEQFPSSIDGNIIILREILIEGPIQNENFFEARSKFICDTYGVSEEEYNTKSKNELLKIKTIPNDSEVHLWFEDDLFCQCNLWYVISALIEKAKDLKIYLIRPDSNSWYGFGAMDQDRLKQSYVERTPLNESHIVAFSQLWDLYIEKEKSIPTKIIQELTSIIPRMNEVIKAHTERLKPNNRPLESLKKILESGKDIDFKTAFKTFTEVEGIYGYGDSSVKRMYDQLLNKE